jgi:hypothetical protein
MTKAGMNLASLRPGRGAELRSRMEEKDVMEKVMADLIDENNWNHYFIACFSLYLQHGKCVCL